MDQPVTALKGIGPAKAAALAKEGIRVLRDLIALDEARQHSLQARLKGINLATLREQASSIVGSPSGGGDGDAEMARVCSCAHSISVQIVLTCVAASILG